MNDIVIIGSGPSSLLFSLYLVIYYPNLRYTIISNNYKVFKCTYGIFLNQIENSWIYSYLSIDKLYTRIFDISINCPDKNTTFFQTNKKIDQKYGIIDNHYLHKKIIDIIKTKVILLTGTVTNIIRQNDTYQVNYLNETSYNINCKFVIEGTGKFKNIGIYRKNNYDLYKQYFVGYKIKLNKDLNIKKCVLIDWYNPDKNDNIKSFAYIIPFDNKTILVEETVLLDKINEPNNYNLLTNRLKKRLEKYNINNYTILETEIDWIPLNTNIPSNNSLSFGVGQCGNLINNISGYTIGYNIYHIPEICQLIINYNFNLKIVIDNFWSLKRRTIYKINMIGLSTLNDLSQNEISEFHKYYFKYIVPDTYHFRIMFLNCDNDFDWFRVCLSYYLYSYFPKKYIWNIFTHLLT